MRERDREREREKERDKERERESERERGKEREKERERERERERESTNNVIMVFLEFEIVFTVGHLSCINSEREKERGEREKDRGREKMKEEERGQERYIYRSRCLVHYAVRHLQVQYKFHLQKQSD